MEFFRVMIRNKLIVFFPIEYMCIVSIYNIVMMLYAENMQ